MPEPATVPVVAGVVIERDGQYLLVQERQPKAHGQWNLPAGKVDVGETIEQAAIREAKEECGYDVKLDRNLLTIHLGIERPVLHAFAAHITGGQLQFLPDEIMDAQWFTRDEINRLDLRSPQFILGALKESQDPAQK
jgi:ADP-ribose pyrophosphatase YjhB (NUDIX family)